MSFDNVSHDGNFQLNWDKSKEDIKENIFLERNVSGLCNFTNLKGKSLVHKLCINS